MPVEFNAAEVYEMAEEIERNGAKFYRKAADQCEAEVRPLLLKLAGMEDQHEVTFKAMHAELPPEASQPLVFDPDDEASAYLQAMADGYVFDVRSDPAEALTGDETSVEVLKMALEREKESVVFFTGMKQMIPEELGKEKVQAIIEEEIDHIGFVSREIKART
ncbi:MAG TPA: ferritin family protein [Armatimonadota bacterium]|nr:ferritin family protein [Armatimonadota bacterium]